MVVGEAADGAQAVAAARRCVPDIAVLDIRMPNADGITVARELLSVPHPPRVIMLTSFALDEYLYTALSAGVDGFLIKDVLPQELVNAVKTVARGDAIISPSMTRGLIQRCTASHPFPDAWDRLRALPEEQRGILALLAQGLSNTEIGLRLGLTESQVKVHVSRILRLLRLANRVQAAILAHSAGLSAAPRHTPETPGAPGAPGAPGRR